jgi:hypothetical protein
MVLAHRCPETNTIAQTKDKNNRRAAQNNTKLSYAAANKERSVAELSANKERLLLVLVVVLLFASWFWPSARPFAVAHSGRRDQGVIVCLLVVVLAVQETC